MFQTDGMKIEERRPRKYFPSMTFGSGFKLWVYQFAYKKSFDESNLNLKQKTGNYVHTAGILCFRKEERK